MINNDAHAVQTQCVRKLIRVSNAGPHMMCVPETDTHPSRHGQKGSQVLGLEHEIHTHHDRYDGLKTGRAGNAASNTTTRTRQCLFKHRRVTHLQNQLPVTIPPMSDSCTQVRGETMHLEAHSRNPANLHFGGRRSQRHLLGLCRATSTQALITPSAAIMPPVRFPRPLMLSLERAMGDSIGTDAILRGTGAFTAEVYPDLPLATTWSKWLQLLSKPSATTAR